MHETANIPDSRWCVHFETPDGETDWVDQVEPHPGAAKYATIDEVERMGFEVSKINSVSRTEEEQSRAMVMVRLSSGEGLIDQAVNAAIGAAFDKEAVE